MMKCKNCKMPIRPDIPYCPNCGAPVHAGAICSLCGQPYISAVQ